jgi:outer membrane protein OmpA-like peptidoglycan-associated protein
MIIEVGRALTSSELQGGVFLVAGHTDGKGNSEYNLALSQRRAESVRQLLIEHFGLSPSSLVAVGFGREKLKNAADPLNPENRRVEIVRIRLPSQ